MKKNGFTLAEVLITLGIIGVVAALTAPALVQNTGSAQIGPKLAKASSTFELACENMLNDSGAAGLHAVLSGSDIETQSESLGNSLMNYMKITYYDTGGTKYGTKGTDAQVSAYTDDTISTKTPASTALNFIQTFAILRGAKYLSKDGYLYMIGIPPSGFTKRDASSPIHRQFFGYLAVDINGIATPNQYGKDIFFFAIYNDGSLRPVGSNTWYEGYKHTNMPNDKLQQALDSYSKFQWNSGEDLCNKESVGSGMTCAGSIFENNLKVIYQ